MKKTAVAIDLGATNLRVALISKEGVLLKKISQKVKKKEGEKAISNQIVDNVKKIIDSSITSIAGIGISSIGPLDYKRGGIVNSPNIPFRFVSLLKPLKKAFALPVYLANDCTASVFGEKIFGAGKKVKNLVYITISTGIGGGAIVDGHLLFGRDGNATEIGHLIVDTKYNLLCSCKKGYGHWEGLASGRNIPRFFEAWIEKSKIKVNFRYKSAKDIFDAAKRGERTAHYFVEQVLGKVNARGVSNVIVAYNPALITLGGAVVLNNEELILEPIKKYIDHYLEPPKIKVTPLGADIGLFGAAAFVFYNPLRGVFL